MKRSRLLLALAALPFAVIKIAPGCAAQQEGQLCNVLNNTSDDCAVDLVCTQLGGYSACCPPSGSTNPACMAGGVQGDGGVTGSGGSGGGGGGGGATTTTTTTSTGGTGGMSSDAGDGGMSEDASDASIMDAGEDGG